MPKTKHDFKVFAEAVNKKIASLHESSFYPDFVCDISREAIKPMKLDDVRKENFEKEETPTPELQRWRMISFFCCSLKFLFSITGVEKKLSIITKKYAVESAILLAQNLFYGLRSSERQPVNVGVKKIFQKV